MKLFKSLLLPVAAIVILIGNSQVMNAQTDKYKFWYPTFSQKISMHEILKNHTLNPELARSIKEALQSKEYKVMAKPHGAIELEKLSFILKKPKGTLEFKYENRIIGSLCINQCAQELNLDLVKAPIKKIMIQGGNYYEVCEKININENKLFSLNQIKQIYKICKRTGYCDIHDGNIINTDEGIAYFCDTEPISFRSNNNPHLTERFLLELIITLEFLKSMKKYMEPEAVEWVTQKLQKIKDKRSTFYRTRAKL